MRLILASALLVTFATAVAAAERIPSFPKRTVYGQARMSLLTLGWKPAPSPTRDDDCSKYDERCEYPETESCSGTGQGFCSYTWKRGETLIDVLTAGEMPNQYVRSVTCSVNCR